MQAVHSSTRGPAMCTLERQLAKSQVVQQPATVLDLQLLTKHDCSPASLTGQVVLQGSWKPAAHILLQERGGNFEEQSLAKLHLPDQVGGEEAVGDVGEHNGGIVISFPHFFNCFTSLCQLNSPLPQQLPSTFHNQGSLLYWQGNNQRQLTSSRLDSETRASLEQSITKKPLHPYSLMDCVLVPQH